MKLRVNQISSKMLTGGEKQSQETGLVCPQSIHTITWETHTSQEMFILTCKLLLFTFELNSKLLNTNFKL